MTRLTGDILAFNLKQKERGSESPLSGCCGRFYWCSPVSSFLLLLENTEDYTFYLLKLISSTELILVNEMCTKVMCISSEPR